MGAVSDASNLEEIAAVRRAAGIRKAYFDKHHDLSAEQVVGLSKWLNASLLAINGAAMIAIINNSDHVKVSIFAISCFISGILMPILSAYVLQVLYSNITSPVFDSYIYWSEVEISGQQDLQTESDLKIALDRAFKFQLVPPALGWLSALAFIAGIFKTTLSLH